MNKLTAKQLREFLNEIEDNGNDLSLIEINFRHDEDSDVTPIGFVFEDLHDENNNALASIVFQAQQTHQVHTHFIGMTTDAYNFVDEMNELIGRKAFSCKTTEVYTNLLTNWVIYGEDITSEEIDRLDLRTDFIIYK